MGWNNETLFAEMGRTCLETLWVKPMILQQQRTPQRAEHPRRKPGQWPCTHCLFPAWPPRALPPQHRVSRTQPGQGDTSRAATDTARDQRDRRFGGYSSINSSVKKFISRQQETTFGGKEFPAKSKIETTSLAAEQNTVFRPINPWKRIIAVVVLLHLGNRGTKSLCFLESLPLLLL